MPTRARVFLLLTFLLSGSLAAQVPDSLVVSGARVRVWTRSRAFVRREGWVRGRSGDSLDIRLSYPINDKRTGTEYARLTLVQLDSAQVSLKTGWTARRSAGTGATFGAAAGAILVLVAISSPSPGWGCGEVDGTGSGYGCPRRVSVAEVLSGGVLGAFVGAIVGGTAGAIVGAWKSERWMAVRLPGR